MVTPFEKLRVKLGAPFTVVVQDTQLVKRLGTGDCPDIDRDPGFLVNVLDQLLFVVAQLFNEALGLVTIKRMPL